MIVRFLFRVFFRIYRDVDVVVLVFRFFFVSKVKEKVCFNSIEDRGVSFIGVFGMGVTVV